MKTYPLLFVCLSLLFTKTADAKSVHALIAADTLTNLQIATIKDIKHIKNELEVISSSLEADLKISIFKHQTLSVQNVLAWTKNADIAPDDILFFYFTGHGVRTKKNTTVWPNLFFPPNKELIDFSDIIALLATKGASFNIIIADCCNNFVKEAPIFRFNAIPRAKSHLSEHNKKNYQKLFSQTKGVIIASASIPGKKSFCTQKGSVFTNAFIKSIKLEIQSSNPSWENILLNSQNISEAFQKPQFYLNISSDS